MITKQISRFAGTLVPLPIFYHFLFICLLYKGFGAGCRLFAVQKKRSQEEKLTKNLSLKKKA